MRKIINFLPFLLLGSVFLFSCGKTYVPIPSTDGSTLQVLHVTPSDTVVLDSTTANLENDAIDFIWSNVNDNGKNAHSYTLQIDAANGDFSNPYSIYVGNLVQSYDNEDFNAIAINLGLTPFVKGPLKARIAYLTSANTTQYSQIITFFVEPYGAP